MRQIQLRVVGGLAIGLAGILAASSAAASDRFEFTVNSAASTFSTSVSIDAPATGSLIGNYDPATNPTGTRTKPGFFGSFGETENVPVPLSVTTSIGGDNTSNPAGSFTLDLDIAGGSVALTGLSANLIGESEPAIEASATLLWNTFRERNPTCLLFGGIPIPFPLGEATLSVFTIAQGSGEAEGVLTPAGPDQFTFAIPVSVETVTEISFLGEPVPSEPQTLPLVFAGTITLTDGGESATISVAIEGFDLVQEVPGPVGEPFSIPFTEPLCSGNLIFTLQIDGLNFELAADAALESVGVKVAACPCDWDGSGDVAVADIFAFISSWFAGEGDFDGENGNGVPDIFAFLACFFASMGACP